MTTADVVRAGGSAGDAAGNSPDKPPPSHVGVGGASREEEEDDSPPAPVASVSARIRDPSHFVFWSAGHPLLSHSLLCSAALLLCATGALPVLDASVVRPAISAAFSALATLLLRLTFLSTAAISLLHRSGALRRYAIKFAESELRKNLNGALVTVSDLRVDVWRGRVVATDLVIHNSDRDAWMWDSPCLARVGRVEATLNFASVVQLPRVGRILDHAFFDVYTVLVEDVQVFVEKRRNVFNFHLLDPSLDIPDAKEVMDDYHKLTRRKNATTQRQLVHREEEEETVSASVSGGSDSDKCDVSKSTTSIDQSSSNREEQRGDQSVVDRELGSDVAARDRREEKANQIVERLVGAVSRIGRAANEGGSKGLQSALMNQKDGLVQNLKQLHTTQKAKFSASPTKEGGKNGVGSGAGGGSSPRKDWKSTKEQGVSVMRELGKVVEENVASIKNQVVFLQKPPGKKAGWVSKPADDIRVGSILLREARIFTRDILVAKGGEGDVAATGDAVPGSSGGGGGGRMGWARPIVILELAITGAELCPPMSARCAETGMPVVGIPIDRLVDIVVKRIMAEVAKSNTGRLLQTAFGDVFSFVNDNVSAGSARNKLV